MKSEVIITPVDQQSLTEITRIHLSAFRCSLLTRIGREAVRRYYEWQFIGPHDLVAIGAWKEETLVGFCFAGKFRGAMSGFLRRNKRWLALQVLIRPWLVLHPEFFEKLKVAVKAINKQSRSGHLKIPGSEIHRKRENKMGILSIAVDPKYRGQGIGRLLLEAVEEIARERGERELELTVRTENIRAIRFYERNGWRRILNGDVWEGRMVKRLA